MNQMSRRTTAESFFFLHVTVYELCIHLILKPISIDKKCAFVLLSLDSNTEGWTIVVNTNDADLLDDGGFSVCVR